MNGISHINGDAKITGHPEMLGATIGANGQSQSTTVTKWPALTGSTRQNFASSYSDLGCGSPSAPRALRVRSSGVAGPTC